MSHALSCKTHGGLIRRHDGVKDVLAEMCKAARLCHEVEPRQALKGNKLRPDILIRFGKDGYDLAIDLTIESPIRDEHSISLSIRDEQKFLSQAAVTKTRKYQEECGQNGASFVPIVLSAVGGVLEESYTEGLHFLIKKIKKSQFISPNWAAPNRTSYWMQRIAIALWSGNVTQVSSFLQKKPLRC